MVDDSTNVWRSWDLSSLAAAWVNEPASNYGVILEAPASSSSRESLQEQR